MKLLCRIALFCTALPAIAFAVPPNACEVLKLEDVNSIAAGTVEKAQQRKSGNPSECGYVDSRRASVLAVSLREVQYAAENELQHERENLEKIYRGKVKWLNTVGENAFWMPINKQLVFRKGKLIVSVKFDRAANQTELDTAQVARMVETAIK
jgi:hypothetical protein